MYASTTTTFFTLQNPFLNRYNHSNHRIRSKRLADKPRSPQLVPITSTPARLLKCSITQKDTNPVSYDDLNPLKPILKPVVYTLFSIAFGLCPFLGFPFPAVAAAPPSATAELIRKTKEGSNKGKDVHQTIHEYSHCTKRLLATVSGLLKVIEEVKSGKEDVKCVEEKLEDVNMKKNELQQEIMNGLYAKLRLLKRERDALVKRSDEILDVVLKIKREEESLLKKAKGDAVVKEKVAKLVEEVRRSDEEYNGVWERIAEIDDEIMRRETLALSIGVRELASIERECQILVTEFLRKMRLQSVESVPRSSLTKLSRSEIKEELQTAQRHLLEQIVLPNVLEDEDNILLLDQDSMVFGQRIEQALKASREMQRNLESRIKKKMKRYGNEKRFVVNTPVDEVVKGFPEIELKWMFGNKEVVVPKAVSLHLHHGWKKWREDVKADLKRDLLENAERGKKYMAEKQERILLDRDRVVAKSWYNEERNRWEMDPVAVPYAVSKKLLESARIRHDWAAMYVMLKGDDKEYYVDIKEYDMIYEDFGGFDALYLRMLASGIPAAVQLMWIPFSELNFRQQFLLVTRLCHQCLNGLWSLKFVSRGRDWILEKVRNINDDIMMMIVFPTVEFVIPYRVRILLGMAWPEYFDQTVGATWYLKWQSEAEISFRSRKRDDFQWYLWFLIRTAVYGYVLYHVIRFMKRKIPRLLGYGPLRRNPNLRKLQRVKAYFRFRTRRIKQKKKAGVDPISTAFDQMKRVKNPPIRLKDFASIESMREEINEVVTFLQNPRAFQEMGARAPRGVLIVGERGTGKTTLALAIAAEAKVPLVEVKAHGKSPMSQEDADLEDDVPFPSPPSETNPATNSTTPAYMTVGTGSTSQHAARLQSMLDQDSGYGGSITGDEGMVHKTHRATTDTDWQARSGAIHQLWYNQHRVALGRSINRVVELLRELQSFNAKWPAHYPSVQRPDGAPTALSRSSTRPNIQHTNTISGDFTASGPAPPLRRAMTSLEDQAVAESSRAAENRPAPEPRLVTPQIQQEFSILKLDLKLGSLHQAELVHSLEKSSIASLLDGKISSSLKHLLLLRDRIEDTSSKVLVTGDLNAGKSTFCNALLRRKILPEDQQPCTSIFCEVLDARENSGIEEVHAVHHDSIYDRNDETTYDVFTLQELEKIVTDNEAYTQCKVYVRDSRTIDESLLNNGVVDIALIDAPGLNSDTTKTTAIFARQEEIDVVVFVVSAANHFTLTAKEFIWAAAAEKAYLFIVVNGFDTIRDKERCQKMILDQVGKMSPRTYKEAGELVHFVSSNAIPMAPVPPGGPAGSGGGSGSGGGGDEPGDDDPKGKGKDKEKLRDFTTLEQSLRRFVLEKRARSKLAPAKTYLLNILNDVHRLAEVNEQVAQSELERVTKELKEIEPLLESSKRAKAEISDQVDKTIEETCQDVYDTSRRTINLAIEHAGDHTHGVPYPGLFGAFEYAEELKEAMMAEIAASVTLSEEHARERTVKGVNAIKQLGILHLGNEYSDLNFRPDVMFRRKRDSMARQVDIPTELWDFVDWSTLLQRQEKVAGTGMALTLATAVGTQMIGGYGWMNHALSAVRVLGNDNLRRMILPGLALAALTAAYYILNQIPQSLPHRLNAKIATQLAEMDYAHVNSTRIAGSVRKVLRFPADSLRVGLQRSVEQLDSRRDETLRIKGESEVARKYFSNLVLSSDHERHAVERVDLDAVPPGTVPPSGLSGH